MQETPLKESSLTLSSAIHQLKADDFDNQSLVQLRSAFGTANPRCDSWLDLLVTQFCGFWTMQMVSSEKNGKVLFSIF
ncbi:hypothetical protein [Ensifer adhaerens]|uniref:hypothetical protein n=1 Tax=Ensifer adhaerens TaxID=106592 RepID=UPI001CF079BF|nr:hypothetical protein [Ensifer adhaerens]UCM23709.1 hypothetical protein LDL63_28440 [Ensifer adhaerens]